MSLVNNPVVNTLSSMLVGIVTPIVKLGKEAPGVTLPKLHLLSYLCVVTLLYLRVEWSANTKCVIKQGLSHWSRMTPEPQLGDY